MKGTSATRQEMLERNPQLKKYWLSRLLVGSILMGARMEEDEWKHIRLLAITMPILVAAFIFNILYTPDMPIARYLTGTTFVVFFSLGWILILVAVYGYINRQHLDTTGSVKGDFRNLRRYGIWYGLIGIGISTGVGIFSWLKWWA